MKSPTTSPSRRLWRIDYLPSLPTSRLDCRTALPSESVITTPNKIILLRLPSVDIELTGSKPYHLTHHKSLGVDGLDTDLPTALEAFFLDSVLGKAFFCTFQILFYAIRPMMVYQLPMTRIHAFNIATQVLFDILLTRCAGANALAYLIISSFFAGSLHPCAGHFIAEHYVLEKKTKGTSSIAPVPETFSYYGPLNMLTYNVGLHNEHHDFPAIPWTRLPALHKTAREFYFDLPSHQSWIWVMWQFIVDKEVGLWCRVKREGVGRKIGRKIGGQRKEELGFNKERR